MSGLSLERNNHKISSAVIGRLGSPQDEAMLHIESSLNRLSQGADPNTHGLLLNVCRQLISRSGDSHVLTKEELVAKLQNKYTIEEVSGVVNELQSRGLLTESEGQLKLSNSILSRLIHAKVQAETANQQKIEAFIANRHEYFLEKAQLLSEQDMNYITPFMRDVVLKPEQQKFIEQSKLSATKQKRRSSMTIAIVFALLSLLSAAAIFFAVDSSKQTSVALRQTEMANAQATYALEQQRLANERAAQARDAEDKARDAAEQARNAEREATQAKFELEEANKQIRGLLSEVTDESNAAKRAQKYAEEQRSVAMERALEIEKLNKDLNLYADDKEREAQAAREAEANATDLRNVLLSRVVAKRSLNMKEGDADLKAYTAMLAYQINSTAIEGDILYPDIYRAVYQAARNFQGGSVSEAFDIGDGAINSISVKNPSSGVVSSSDGSIWQFEIDPASGTFDLGKYRHLFALPHDAINHIFVQQSGNAFVLGAFDQVIEISLDGYPLTNIASISSGKKKDVIVKSELSPQKRKFEIPGGQFVKSAYRLSEDELMIQTADLTMYTFNCTDGSFTQKFNSTDGAVAWTVLPNEGLICYVNMNEELILTDMNRNVNVAYAKAKKDVAQMQLKQYGNTIYLVLAYTDGELEIYISPREAFMNAYDNRYEGKSLYQIKSLRASLHSGYISQVVFAESRALLAVCSYDRSVTVWDLKRWEERQADYQPLILDDHDDWIMSCAFLPGDKSLITGSKHGTLKYWNLDPFAYASSLCDKIRRVPNEEEWGEYIGNELSKFKGEVCIERN